MAYEDSEQLPSAEQERMSEDAVVARKIFYYDSFKPS
jgi:hypothetical protein